MDTDKTFVLLIIVGVIVFIAWAEVEHRRRQAHLQSVAHLAEREEPAVLSDDGNGKEAA